MKQLITITVSIEPVTQPPGRAEVWSLVLNVPAFYENDPKQRKDLPALSPEALIRFLPKVPKDLMLTTSADLLRYLSGHMIDSNGNRVLPAERVFVEFGQKLFENSFGQHPLWSELREYCIRQGHALRFILRWNDRQLRWQAIREVPWELLHDGQFIFRSTPSTHLIEQVPLTPLGFRQEEQPRAPALARNALLLTVEDSQHSNGPLGAESLRSFEQAMQEQLHRAGYNPTVLKNGTAGQVKSAFKTKSYQLFFAVCHGRPDSTHAGSLLCASNTTLSGEDLAEAIGHGKAPHALEMAILASCWSGSTTPGPLSGMAQHLVKYRAASYALAFTTEVSTRFALALAQSFLIWLSRGVSQAQAFHLARLGLKHIVDWWAARLFVGDSVPLPEYLVAQSPVPLSRRQLHGRRLEVSGLLDWLRRPEDLSMAVLIGPSGSGKTELALCAMNHFWTAQRDNSRDFSTTVIWIDMAWEAHIARQSQLGQERSALELLLNKIITDLKTTPLQPLTPEQQRKPEAAFAVGDCEAEIASWQTQNASGDHSVVVVVDGWPAETPLPAALACQNWKILVTTSGTTVRLNQAPNKGSAPPALEILELEMSPLRWEHAQHMLGFEQLSKKIKNLPNLIDSNGGFWPLHLHLLHAGLCQEDSEQPELLKQLELRGSPPALHARRTEILVTRLLSHLSDRARQLLESSADGTIDSVISDDQNDDQLTLQSLAESGLIVRDAVLMRHQVNDAVQRCLPSLRAP